MCNTSNTTSLTNTNLLNDIMLRHTMTVLWVSIRPLVFPLNPIMIFIADAAVNSVIKYKSLCKITYVWS